MAKIIIAGASGFVGRFLVDRLKNEHDIIALSRSPKKSEHPRVEWRQCDFFSLKESHAALRGGDVAFYLVHSMQASARLTQGSFQDFDLIAADNFARAAQACGLKQIIYLSGVVDEGSELSRHLESRLEVEKLFSQYPIPLTSLRAGLIIGPGGSSFKILQKLVQRLPLMLLPRWTSTLSHPVSVFDVVEYLRYVILNPEAYSKEFEMGGPEAVTYEDLIRKTSLAAGKKRFFIRVPLSSPELSKLWVRLVSGESKELVNPLVESLNCRMDVKDQRLKEMCPLKLKNLDEAIRESFLKSAPSSSSRCSKEASSDVRSVQRLYLPPQWTALNLVQAYLRWLPRFFSFFMKVASDEKMQCQFYFRFAPWVLLELTRDDQFSQPDRQLLRITGGILARNEGRARLEFREVPGTPFALAAIHDFRPRLPWLLYEWTQARLHLWVMRRFNLWLKKKCV